MDRVTYEFRLGSNGFFTLNAWEPHSPDLNRMIRLMAQSVTEAGGKVVRIRQTREEEVLA